MSDNSLDSIDFEKFDYACNSGLCSVPHPPNNDNLNFAPVSVNCVSPVSPTTINSERSELNITATSSASSISATSGTNDNIQRLTKLALQGTLPSKSTTRYQLCFKKFEDWQTENQITDVTEPTMLAYFQILSQKYSPNSLWSFYSMLKKLIALKCKVDMSKYYQLLAFIKCKNNGYQPTKANVFTQDQTQKFMNEAPDDVYLIHNVS
mgnify:CR=1 FL=1